ncbi:echinoderm microtubule-associated protein-like 1 isoform X3 [Ptychodera flava]|uniref:echinoderm microtubule-associated protein-like 1 isoform X3 n=1 Tax=Ptychodera flava TaxID=63121 RepID=UPI00396A84DC
MEARKNVNVFIHGSKYTVTPRITNGGDVTLPMQYANGRSHPRNPVEVGLAINTDNHLRDSYSDPGVGSSGSGITIPIEIRLPSRSHSRSVDRIVNRRERRMAVLARAEELLRANRLGNSTEEDEEDFDDHGGDSSQDADDESWEYESKTMMTPSQETLLQSPQAHTGQPLHKESKGKRITFFRNGDRHYKGQTIPVNHRNFPSWETLLVYLGEKIKLPYGVRNVYTLSGRLLGDISELEHGKGYVCASGNFVSGIPYGQSGERYWQNRKPTGGIRRADKPLYQRQDPPGMLGINVSPIPGGSRASNESPTNSQRSKPRVITVISNTHRDSKAKILLNAKTTQSFEEVLRDMTQALTMRTPPIRSLYTWKTEERVQSFTQLFRDFKDHDVFVACGAEDLLRTPPAENAWVRSEPPRQSDVRGSQVIAQMKKKPKKRQRQDPPQSYTQQPGMHYPPPPQQRSPINRYSPTSTDMSLDSGPLSNRQGYVSGSEESYPGNPKPFTFRGPHPREELLPPMQPGRRPQRQYDDLRYDPRRARDEMQPNKAVQVANSQNYPPPIDSDRKKPLHHQRHKGIQADGTVYNDNRRRSSLDPVKIKIHGQTREFYPPSNVNTRYPDPNTRPDKKLKLEWVYGYRGYDARCNLHVIESGEIAYFVGAVAVLYDLDLDFQRHYTGHNEDIQCMAVHPTENYIATGQMAGQLPDSTAHIRVWETETLCTHAILGLEVFQTGIVSLNFSVENSGEWLVVLDEGDNHVLSVWDWNDDKLIANTKTHPDTVIFAVFHPHDDSCIITGGKQHLYFWKLMNNKILRDKKSGVFEEDKPKYVTCIEFAQNGDVITGDSNGSITVWSKDSASVYRAKHRIQHAHEKSVFALCMLADGTLLSGGGVDRKLIAWDSLRAYSSAKAERVLPESAGGIRTITPRNTGSADGVVVVGTTRNCILEGSLQMKFRNVVQGHCEEIWALAVHPQENVFVTGGYDMNVIMWASESHKVIWKTQIERPCLSCAFHPSGSVIALGTTSGRFIILNTYNGMHVTSVQVGNEQLDCIKFSPDGGILAVGSHDNIIYLFSVMDDGQVYRKIGILRGHENFITHIDWSKDGCYIQSVSGNYDLMYWDVNALKNEKSALSMRDVDWSSQSCILGYSLLGVWSSKDVGTDINTVERSQHNDMVVAGDNHGFISIFRYPCTSLKAESHDNKAYSSHVTSVKFLPEDKFLVSTGGLDACIMQWVLVDKNGRYFSSGGSEL